MTNGSDLPHGWDFGDIIVLARTVAATYRWGSAPVGFDEAYIAAYDGIMSALLAAEEAPTRKQLYTAGSRSISGAVGRAYRDVGRPAVGNGARFRAYWMGDRQTEPDPSPHVVENLALWQVFEGLDTEDRETLTALAHHLSVTELQEAMGWGASQTNRRIKKARENFYRLWFEGETPPDLPRRVVVTVPQPAASTYKARGYVYPKENKGGTKYRARFRCQGRLRELGTYDTETEAWAAVERHKASLVLDQFEADHRTEQPAAQQSVRADVGDRPLARMA